QAVQEGGHLIAPRKSCGAEKQVARANHCAAQGDAVHLKPRDLRTERIGKRNVVENVRRNCRTGLRARLALKTEQGKRKHRTHEQFAHYNSLIFWLKKPRPDVAGQSAAFERCCETGEQYAITVQGAHEKPFVGLTR